MLTFKSYIREELLFENIGVFQVRKTPSYDVNHTKYNIHHKGKQVGHILVNNKNKLTKGKLFNKTLPELSKYYDETRGTDAQKLLHKFLNDTALGRNFQKLAVYSK